jgi:hypothetical protein
MSCPSEPDDVKLVASIFSSDKNLIDRTVNDLEVFFGSCDMISAFLLFDYTRYYEKEMGWPLFRRFVSFERLIRPEDLVNVKIKTYDIEHRYMNADNRRVNIDPGIISAERLILATGKNYSHRIYLSNGIYADLTLIYRFGTFRSLEWTYPDYADNNVISFFNSVRADYLLKRSKR